MKHFKVSTTDSFIEKARKIHAGLYDYSQVNYVLSSLKVKIRCIAHNYLFEMTPNNHISGYGCPKCGIEKVKLVSEKRRLTLDEFIKRSNKVHKNRYDYSTVDYVKNDVKVSIICYKHGVFTQVPSAHFAGKGCPICGRWSLLDTKTFIARSRKKHGDKYDYSQVDYVNTRTKVKIICPKHGIFDQTPQIHMKGHGCPICLESTGEKKICHFLDINKIKYERERTFEGCKYKTSLFFDFYLPSINTCIEFDGLQHFQPVAYFGGDKAFKYTKKTDAIKNDFCLKNSINLTRISYKKKDSEISSILKNDVLPLLKV